MRTFKKYPRKFPSSYILIHQFTVCVLHFLERIMKPMKYTIIFFHRCINCLFDRKKPVGFRTSYEVKGEIFSFGPKLSEFQSPVPGICVCQYCHLQLEFALEKQL